MRVGLICHAGFGGSVRIAVDLADSLAERGHDVHLFSRRPPLGRSSFAPGVAVHGLDGAAPEPLSGRLDAAWDAADLRSFARLIDGVARSSALDLVHFHYGVPFAELAAGLKDRLGAAAPAVVGTLHGTDVTTFGRRRRGRSGLVRALRRADALTTVSRSHAAIAAETFGFEPAPEVVPNFVDLARFRPGAPRTIDRARSRIVHVSNFRPVKDPERVARVFVEVCRAVDAELWLVGDGELMPQVCQVLERAGLGDRVRSFGLTHGVEGILAQADLLLLTSRAESFGLVALEAAASGLPVVAPRVGGLPEVVLDGVTGLLFDPDDEAEAVRLAIRILTEPDLADALGSAGVARARRFSRDAVVDRYERVYRRVLEGAPAMVPQSSAAVSR